MNLPVNYTPAGESVFFNHAGCVIVPDIRPIRNAPGEVATFWQAKTQDGQAIGPAMLSVNAAVSLIDKHLASTAALPEPFVYRGHLVAPKRETNRLYWCYVNPINQTVQCATQTDARMEIDALYGDSAALNDICFGAPEITHILRNKREALLAWRERSIKE